MTIGGNIAYQDTVTVTVGNYLGKSTEYTYTVQTADTFATVVTGLVNVINSGVGIDTVSSVSVTYPGGDPNVIAIADTSDDQVILQARVAGFQGNEVTYSATTSSGRPDYGIGYQRFSERRRRCGQRRARNHRIDQRDRTWRRQPRRRT